MMRPSTFFFLTRRGVRNLGKHWAMTIACIASLSVCMTLNIFASLAEVNVGSMVAYLGSQNEMVVYLDPECDDATAAQVGETLSAMPGVSGVKYMSKQDVLNTYRGYMDDYSSLQYFQRVLRESGVIDKLDEMGVQEGDTVDILGFRFEYIH